jgi:hypothetical protein
MQKIELDSFVFFYKKEEILDFNDTKAFFSAYNVLICKELKYILTFY